MKYNDARMYIKRKRDEGNLHTLVTWNLDIVPAFHSCEYIFKSSRAFESSFPHGVHRTNAAIIMQHSTTPLNGNFSIISIIFSIPYMRNRIEYCAISQIARPVFSKDNWLSCCHREPLGPSETPESKEKEEKSKYLHKMFSEVRYTRKSISCQFDWPNSSMMTRRYEGASEWLYIEKQQRE